MTQKLKAKTKSLGKVAVGLGAALRPQVTFVKCTFKTQQNSSTHKYTHTYIGSGSPKG